MISSVRMEHRWGLLHALPVSSSASRSRSSSSSSSSSLLSSLLLLSLYIIIIRSIIMIIVVTSWSFGSLHDRRYYCYHHLIVVVVIISILFLLVFGAFQQITIRFGPFRLSPTSCPGRRMADVQWASWREASQRWVKKNSARWRAVWSQVFHNEILTIFLYLLILLNIFETMLFNFIILIHTNGRLQVSQVPAALHQAKERAEKNRKELKGPAGPVVNGTVRSRWSSRITYLIGGPLELRIGWNPTTVREIFSKTLAQKILTSLKSW